MFALAAMSETPYHEIMAESKIKNPVSPNLKIYDENDELELFSVELMRNLMKYFNNANFVVMPALPKPSKRYSATILQSVALGWQITHTNFSRRFGKDFNVICRSRRDLFTYAVCQAAKFFDGMYSHAQLIFLAAYCYELSCFLSRNGQEEYIYVSYGLFSTIWRSLYETKFDRRGGWAFIEKALNPYVVVLKSLEDLFLPGYLFDFEDLLSVQVEYAIILHRCLEPGNKPVDEELRIIFGELEDRMRRRVVTMDDTEMDFLEYVLNFKQLKFFDEIQAYTEPMRLMDYLAYRSIEDQQYKGLAVLRELKKTEDFEDLCDSPSESDSEGSSDESPIEEIELAAEDTLTDSCQRLLLSCAIHEIPHMISIEAENSSENKSKKDNGAEKEPPATTGDAKTQHEKSGAEGEEIPQKESPKDPTTTCSTESKNITELQSDD